MHKNLFIIMPMILMTMTPALARLDDLGSKGNEPKHGNRSMCYYIKSYGSKHNNNNWVYIYCGKQESGCDGHKDKGHDLSKWHIHGDGFKSHNRTFWCCNKTPGTAGYYVETPNWIVETKNGETKSVGNGTCITKIEIDACGDEHPIDCDTTTNCNAGYVSRNGECAPECPIDYAFASERSNECVPCATTNYQGIVTDAMGYGVCRKCDSAIQFFNRAAKECVLKNAGKQYSKLTLKTCFMCPTWDLYMTCIDIVQNNATDAPTQILAKCHINKNELNIETDDED